MAKDRLGEPRDPPLATDGIASGEPLRDVLGDRE